MNFKKCAVIIACLWLLISSGNVISAQSNEAISGEVSQIGKTIEKASKPFDYELHRVYQTADEWEAEEKKKLLHSHAYYMLQGKDSDGSCLNMTGRIAVTVLQFKDPELAVRHIAERKEYHQGNIFFEFTRSNKDGFLVNEANGFYAAVIKGSTVILLEDRTRVQREFIKSMADTLTRELR